MTVRLLITSGRSPAEYRIAVAKLLQVMASEAADPGLDFDTLAGMNPDGLGPLSSIALFLEEAAARFARSWTGSVQWIAQSTVRPTHKRKNWFIGVSELLADYAPIRAVDARDVHFAFLRAGGPGGQHQNKTESAVSAIHRPSGICAVVREFRSQHRIKAIALERLGKLLRLAGELNASTAQ